MRYFHGLLFLTFVLYCGFLPQISNAVLASDLCIFIRDDFSTPAQNDWSYGKYGNWYFDNGEFGVQQVPDGKWAVAETAFNPGDFFSLDIELNMLNNPLPEDAVALYAFSRDDAYFTVDSRPVDGVAVVVYPALHEMEFMVWNSSDESRNFSDLYPISSDLTSFGVSYTSYAVIFRANGRDTTLQLSGDFSYADSVIDTLWIMAKGSGIHVHFDNLCGMENSVGPYTPMDDSVPATPENFSYLLDGSRLTLKWDKVAGAQGYRLGAGFSPGVYDSFFELGDVSQLGPLDITGISPGVYYLAVMAYNSEGESEWSEEQRIILPPEASLPPRPANFRYVLNGDIVTFYWDSSANTDWYEIGVALSPGAYDASIRLENTNTLGPIDLTTVPAGTYYLAVRGVNQAGSGEYSNELAITVGNQMSGDVSDETTVQPSDQEQTVSAGGIKIVIPGGLLDNATTLRVTRLSSPPVNEFKALPVGAAYNIELGNLHQFSKPITIRIPYDPSKLRTDMTEERAVVAGYYNDSRNAWTILDAVVDTSRHELVVNTSHLTIYGWLKWATLYGVVENDRFTVAWDPAEFKDPEKKPDEVYEKYGDPSNWVDPDVPDYVEDTVVYLGIAYHRYKMAGFREPATPINVYVGTASDSYRAKFTGGILINLNNMDQNSLKLMAAHELFHSFQSAYMYAAFMGAKVPPFNWDVPVLNWGKWYLEASAEYAAEWVAWHGTLGKMAVLNKPIQKDFLTYPIYDTSEHHDYGYHESIFIKYLVDHGADFKAMSEELFTAEIWNLNDYLGPLDAYLKEAISLPYNSLDRQFQNFARYFVFDTNSPMPPLTGSLYSEVASYRDTISYFDLSDSSGPDQNHGTLAGDSVDNPVDAPPLGGTVEVAAATFELTGGLAAKLWGIHFDPKYFNNSQELKLKVVASDAFPSDVEAEVFVLPNDQRRPGGLNPAGTISVRNREVDVNVRQGDALYVLAVNAAYSSVSFTLSLLMEFEQEATTPSQPACVWNQTGISQHLNSKATFDGASTIKTFMPQGPVYGCSDRDVLNTSHGWTIPPASLSPGSSVSFAVSASWSLDGPPLCSSSITGISTYVKAGATVVAKTGDHHVVPSAHPTGAMSNSGTWRVPECTNGDTLSITAHGEQGGAGGSIIYKYRCDCTAP